AQGGVVQGERDGDLGVGAPGRSCRPRAAAEGVATEEGVEQVAEAEGVARGGAGPRRARAVLSEHVVAAPAFRIAEGLVRDGDVLEAGLGVGVVGMGVGGVPAGGGGGGGAWG